MQIEEQIITHKIQFVTISYTNAKFNFQTYLFASDFWCIPRSVIIFLNQ